MTMDVDLSDDANSGECSTPPASIQSLSTELLCKVLKDFNRNTIDDCKLVCRRWYSIIQRYSDLFSRRRIDYIIFSTKNKFSLTARAENRIRVFEFRKYYQESQLSRINEMTTRTIHCTADYFDPLLNNDRLLSASSWRIAHDQHLHTHPYRLYTPPSEMFQLLNRLLVDYVPPVTQVGFLHCELSATFIERLLLTVQPTITANQIPWFEPSYSNAQIPGKVSALRIANIARNVHRRTTDRVEAEKCIRECLHWATYK